MPQHYRMLSTRFEQHLASIVVPGMNEATSCQDIRLAQLAQRTSGNSSSSGSFPL